MMKLFSLLGYILISAYSIAGDISFVYEKNISNSWTNLNWPGVTLDDLLVGEFLSDGIRATNVRRDNNRVLMNIGTAEVAMFVNSSGKVQAYSSQSINGLCFTPAKAQVVLTKTNYSNFDEALAAAGGGEVKILADAELVNAPNTALTLTIAEGLKVVINGNVIFDRIYGRGVIELAPDAVVRQLNAKSLVENPLAGSGIIIIKNVKSTYELAEDSSVSFRVDSTVDGSWTVYVHDNVASFIVRSWHQKEGDLFSTEEGKYTQLFSNITLAELKNGDAFTLRATLEGGDLAGRQVSQSTVFGEIINLKCEVQFIVGDKCVKIQLAQDGSIIKGRQLEISDYRIVGVAAAIPYEVGGVQVWKSLPEDVVPEDVLVLDDSAELTLGFSLSNPIEGKGKVFSAVETTADIKKVILPSAWILEHYPEGDKNGADIGENGITLWKSYCLGLDPTDSSSLPVLSIIQTSSPDSLQIVDLNVAPNALPEVNVTRTLLEGVPGGVFTELSDDSVSEIDSGFVLELLPTSPKVRFFKLKYEFD